LGIALVSRGIRDPNRTGRYVQGSDLGFELAFRNVLHREEARSKGCRMVMSSPGRRNIEHLLEAEAVALIALSAIAVVDDLWRRSQLVAARP
jgi:hypothetical protein